MGLLKKIFKPVAKVLDKVIPNEIKPALPYLAAFAPVFAPAGIQSLLGQTMMRRAITSGGLNILGQLSQEGSEGDINLLSAGLGALSGAMTAPANSITGQTSADFFRSKMTPTGNFKDVITDTVIKRPELTGLQKATNFGLEGLAKGSEMFAAGQDAGLFSKAGLKAATIPAATATGDVMQAQGRQLEKQAAIDAALAEAEALADSGLRGDAIRNAMRAYGFFTDDEIEETVSSAGYRAGGRVGFDNGGGLFSFLFPDEGRDTFQINEVVAESSQRGKLPYDTTAMILELNRDGKSVEEISEITGIDVSDVGEMLSLANMESPIEVVGGAFPGDALNKMLAKNLEIRERPANLSYDRYVQPERRANGGRAGFKFGGIDAAIEKIEDESIKESAKMVADMPDMDLMDLIEEFEIIFKRKPMNMEELKQFYRENYEMESPVRMKEKIKETVTMKAKDGGLMATRINMENGGDLLALGEGFKSERLNKMAMDMFGKTLRELNADEMEMLREEFNIMKGVTEAKDGGLMDLGGKEMDLRGGGFVPIGKKERADDVPARLSKNEFVMTADAVRAAGGGSVNEGAKRMYKVMNDLEARA